MSTSTSNAMDSASRPNSYGQIVKSSSIMGGVAAISLIFGMIRTKAAAVLIGTTGAGLLANFVAVQSVATNLSGLGIGSSAVRDVAKAHGSDNPEEVARTVLTLQRACMATGLAGALAMGLLSPWISRLTFGSGDYTWHIAVLGITILLGNLQAGQTAVIQGTRRIPQLARLQLGAAVGGTLVSVLMYFWLGIQGLVPALVLLAMINLAIAHFFARQVPVRKIAMSYAESFRNAKGMARLGVALMWNTLAGSAAAYGINSIITHQMGIQALGIYSAGFALSGMFANFVLGAMASDYYPRLAGVADDDHAINRLVNEQTEVGLLLAVPGLVATITLAPWVIHVFYSQEFLPAVTLLHWFTLGCLGRVISWPLAYLLMAKSRTGWMMACETAIQFAHVLLVLFGIRSMGLPGAGVAFFAVYVLYTGMVFFATRSVTRFAWSRPCARQIASAMGFLLVAWSVAHVDSLAISTALAVPCIAAAGLLSLRGLSARLGSEHPFTRMFLRIPVLGRIASTKPRSSGQVQ